MTYIPPTEDRLSERDAFRGRWERRGLVMVPVIEEETELTAAEKACGWKAPITIWDTLAKSFADNPMPLTGHACDDCGCLLINADELCPNCVRPWMYAQEAAFNERRPVIYYSSKNRKGMAA